MTTREDGIDPERCLEHVRAWANDDGEWAIVMDDVFEVCDLAAKAALYRDLMRQRLCPSDGAMTTAECMDSGRCNCSAAEKVTPSQERQQA